MATTAAGRGNAEVVRTLLDHGFALQDPEFDEHSLLSEAARLGRLEVVKLLIERGADPNSVGKNGMTALDWALQNDHTAVVEFLCGISGKSQVET